MEVLVIQGPNEISDKVGEADLLDAELVFVSAIGFMAVTQGTLLWNTPSTLFLQSRFLLTVWTSSTTALETPCCAVLDGYSLSVITVIENVQSAVLWNRRRHFAVCGPWRSGCDHEEADDSTLAGWFCFYCHNTVLAWELMSAITMVFQKSWPLLSTAHNTDIWWAGPGGYK